MTFALNLAWVGRGALVIFGGLAFAFLSSIAIWNKKYLDRLARSRTRLPGARTDIQVARASARHMAIAGLVVGGVVAFIGLVLVLALGLI
jgi:hypothetical protein